MRTKTKIVCTIGPSVDSLEKIKELIVAGMNVARLNFSHGSHKDHLRYIQLLKQAREELSVPLAIMLDTKGPEVRLGSIREKELFLPAGHRWLLVKEEVEGDQERVTIRPGGILDQLSIDTQVLFNDGYICSRVISTGSDGVLVEIENGGKLGTGKGVNIPGISLDLPAISEKDIADIRFGCEQGIDMIAASFVRTTENIARIKKFLIHEGSPQTLIIAKIENHEGVENFDSIIQVADGAMVARGDLGVEVPLSQVPRLQKQMIRKCYLAGKPAIIATQMLESMMVNPRPTRAEASDIANAIYDSASALMLSGETAAGLYPIEAVHVMRRIIYETESSFDSEAFWRQHSEIGSQSVLFSLTLAAVKTAQSTHATAIFAFTMKGRIARLLARIRPEMAIIAMTTRATCYHQMALYWGVIPLLAEKHGSFAEAFSQISAFALKKELVSYGDLVVCTAGRTFSALGTSNMIIVENIGDVLVRGDTGMGGRVSGSIKLIPSLDDIEIHEADERIIVINQCNEHYLPLIQKAKGVILQNHIEDRFSEAYALEAIVQMDGKGLITSAEGAFDTLKDEQLVTLDPDKALVYNGIFH